MSKELAEGVVLTLDRTEFGGWDGAIFVNNENEATARVSGPTFYGVLDGLIEGAFWDDVGAEAIYTLGEK